MTYFRLFHWRYLRQHRFATALIVIGVAIGVAAVAAIDLANASALRSFRRALDVVTGKATHLVIAPYPGVPEDLWPTLRLHDAVLEAAPVLEGRLVLQGRALPPLRLSGIDVLSAARFLPRGDSPVAESLVPFLRDPRGVVLARSFALRCGVIPGDPLAVAINGRRELLHVVRTFDDATLGSGSDDLAIMDIAAAQEITRRVGFLSHVDLVLRDGREAEVAAVLPPGVRLERAAARGDHAENLLEAFRLNLFALSLLAVFVGAFLAFNAMQSAIVRRRALIGIARSLGATRRHVFVGFLAEAVVLGSLGTVLGLVLGALLARTLVTGVAQTISNLYFDVRPGPVELSAATVLKASLTGMGAVLLAALFPAREAARTTPRAAWLRSLVELEFGSQVPRLLWFGVGAVIMAVLVLRVSRASLWPPLAAALCACVALACAVPFAARVLLPLLDATFRKLQWLLPALGARTLLKSLSRSGVAMAALTVALSMAVGVMVMIASFRDTVVVWVDGHVRADVYLEPDRGGVAREMVVLPGEVVTALANDPEVAACDTLQRAATVVSGREVQVSGVNAALLGEHAHFRFRSGDAARAWQRLAAGDALVSEVFANVHGVEVDDVIELGGERVRVAAVFYDYSVNQGYVLVDHARFERIFQVREVSGASLYLRPNVNVEQKVEQLKMRFAADYVLTIRSNRGLREEVLRIFDRTFAITYVLQTIAMALAVFGVATTLLALATERAREIATMRALGLSARGLRQLHLSEGGILGGLCALFSVGGGAVLAWILIRFVNVRSFHWSIAFTFPAPVWGFFVALAIAVSMLASLWPAASMVRQSIARALRNE